MSILLNETTESLQHQVVRNDAVWPVPLMEANPLLNRLGQIEERLRESAGNPQEVHAVMDDLFLTLRAERARCQIDEWRSLAESCRQLPLKDLLHEDPFTRRAFAKPRGYAGDAEMMDYIYRSEEGWPLPECSRLGRSIFEFTTAAPASEGVRARRGYVADLIDETAATVRQPHVLAVAAGHLREADLSQAVRRRKLGRLVALDADAMSLTEVDRCYGRYGVETVHANLKLLLLGKRPLGEYDLIYSTGLFDYLNESIGRRLVRGLFEMLRPRGQLVVANFLPDIRDVGYMETFMDWQLVYRTRTEMVQLAADVPEGQIREIQLRSEECRNISFLRIVKES